MNRKTKHSLISIIVGILIIGLVTILCSQLTFSVENAEEYIELCPDYISVIVGLILGTILGTFGSYVTYSNLESRYYDEFFKTNF